MSQCHSPFHATLSMSQHSKENRPKPWASFEQYCRSSEQVREVKSNSTQPPASPGPPPMTVNSGPQLVSTPRRAFTSTSTLSDISNRYLPTPSSEVVPSSGVCHIVLDQQISPSYTPLKQCSFEDHEMKEVPQSTRNEQGDTCARSQGADITQESHEERPFESKQVVVLARKRPYVPSTEPKRTDIKTHAFVSRIPVSTRARRPSPCLHSEERDPKRPRREVEIKSSKASYPSQPRAVIQTKGNGVKQISRWI